MDLQGFIHEALFSIVNGIKMADDDLRKQDASFAVVVPFIKKAFVGSETKDVHLEASIQEIEFDVAVTVGSENVKERSSKVSAEGRTEGFIKVLAADASLSGEMERRREDREVNTKVSRIRFTVRVAFNGRNFEFEAQNMAPKYGVE